LIRGYWLLVLPLLLAWPGPVAPLTSRFVHVNGIRINYLDWGGHGPPLVMIHGLGDSPHIFDDLAPRLRSRFHVYAYARRGHGHSDAPAGAYDLATLTDDLRLFLDALHIPRADLLGWSMGGNEITRFAGLHPERVGRLVYLEAGYDFSDTTFLDSFAATLARIGPDAPAVRSLGSYREWMHASVFGRNVVWTPGLEHYLRDVTRVRPDGRIEVIPSERVFSAIFRSLPSSPREYTHVRAPCLFFYASTFFPAESHGGDPAARAFERFADAFREAQIERVRHEVRDATIERVPGATHMSIGVRDPGRLAARVRTFLLTRRS